MIYEGVVTLKPVYTTDLLWMRSLQLDLRKLIFEHHLHYYSS